MTEIRGPRPLLAALDEAVDRQIIDAHDRAVRAEVLTEAEHETVEDYLRAKLKEKLDEVSLELTGMTYDEAIEADLARMRALLDTGSNPPLRGIFSVTNRATYAWPRFPVPPAVVSVAWTPPGPLLPGIRDMEDDVARLRRYGLRRPSGGSRG